MSTPVQSNSFGLVPYNANYVPQGQGFINLGATCHFNSLLQCILSNPVIYETLIRIKDQPHVKNNRLAQYLIKLWSDALEGKPIHEKGIPIWHVIEHISKKQNNLVRMDSGQQDAHEDLMMFLDAIETIPEVRQLFEHRHNILVYCDNCADYVIDKFEENLVFEAQSDLKTDQLEKYRKLDKYYQSTMLLNDFLRSQNGYVDDNHKCPKCQIKCSKFKTTTLTMVPEILTVVFKKYLNKNITPFPNTLEFVAKNETQKLIYKLVAQSEHAGGMGGGHYWAVCRRKEGWVRLNDSSVSAGEPGPTANTYMVFYNFVGVVDM